MIMWKKIGCVDGVVMSKGYGFVLKGKEWWWLCVMGHSNWISEPHGLKWGIYERKWYSKVFDGIKHILIHD